MTYSDRLAPGAVPDREDKARAFSITPLFWLFGVFFICLLTVVGLRIVFADIYAQLERRSANERARLFIGEEIVFTLQGVEKDIYRMATTLHAPAMGRLRQEVDAKVDKIEHDLVVLRDGGTVRREVLLNIEGRDAMVQQVSYKAPEGQSYVMEVIELAPLLDQVRDHANRMEGLLADHQELHSSTDRRRIEILEQEIGAFIKQLQPFFARINENANRLFFDSSDRLRLLESDLARQKRTFELAELALTLLVVVLAAALGWRALRQASQANRSLHRAWENLEAAKNEAERASRAKSDFVSRMSHELRTPLNAILGFAELLEGEPLQPSHRNYVHLINRSGEHLLELINSVLDHAKIEAGHLSLENVVFDPRATVDGAAVMVGERASAKGLRFAIQTAPDVPSHVSGDPTRLRQVLINLMANAIKFTEVGSVTLDVMPDGERLRFSVTDTGIGMDESVLARLFKPFSQADESITRKFGGTGLGLLVSQELVRLMGGEIQVESTPGRGSRFWFSLALPPAPPPAAGVALPTGGGEQALMDILRGPVLLVDDNRVNITVATAMLAKLGIVPDTAADGQEALDRLTARPYALVLMDMEMPVMDGVAATRRWRAQEAAGHVPIIAMTANALRSDLDRCLAAGMDGYVTKPVHLNALEEEIRRVLGMAFPAGLPAQAAVLDRATALARLGDDEALYAELVSLFVNDAPRQLQAIGDAMAVEDWSALHRHAHTLKGLLATFGAARGEAQSRELEVAAALADRDRCASLVPVVRQETEMVLQAMRGAGG